tara:strand:- start:14 stop:904 length:891 start_codon:yes stop_codon:yes gene_type:complete
MSISGQNLTVVIVTLKSENIIDQCINSINQELPIIVVENSNNSQFKDRLESKYKNIKCILSKSNLGMGSGNNIGIREAKTDFVLILNPDVLLDTNTLKELFSASEQLSDFSILAPLEKRFPNYGIIKEKYISDIEKEINKDKNHPFKVQWVDGFAMLLNKKKLEEDVYFDESFFMYLENNDLCRRITQKGGSVFIVPKAKINHLSAKTVDKEFENEVELSRNWHWIWSKFYYNKKHSGILKALRECAPSYFSSVLKIIFYFLTNNKTKKKIYFNRASGFYNALIGKTSWYRPNLNN